MNKKLLISSNIQKIKEYSRINSDIWENAHHFLYDKRYSNSEVIHYVVMGINPGEPGREVTAYPRVNELLEETSEYDYLADDTKSKPATKWRNSCRRACGTLDIALTEAFFWSSKGVKELNERWDRKTHWDFCVKMNKELIEIHNPKAVIFSGISHLKEIALHYGLEPIGEIIPNEKGHRLIAPFKDHHGRPWIFVKHFSARPSKFEIEKIKNYIGAECWKS